MSQRVFERIGSVIDGRYRLDGLLGRGGVGVVYSATHTWTGRRVAVKLLYPEYGGVESVVRRFLFEARAAAQLRHPNVVDVLDMGTDDGTLYLVLELLEGRSLGEILSDESSLSVDRTLELLLPVIAATEAAHVRGIVHRDMKPENIFVSRDFRGHEVPKLIDFGVACAIQEAQRVGADTPERSTVGTPNYMAPEQISGECKALPVTDVWAMGVILYECLTGVTPFRGDTLTAVLASIIQGHHRPLTDYDHVPRSVAMTIEHTLAVQIDERTPSMHALRMALSEARQLLGSTARASSVPAPQRRGPDTDTVQLRPLRRLSPGTVEALSGRVPNRRRSDIVERTPPSGMERSVRALPKIAVGGGGPGDEEPGGTPH